MNVLTILSTPQCFSHHIFRKSTQQQQLGHQTTGTSSDSAHSVHKGRSHGDTSVSRWHSAAVHGAVLTPVSTARHSSLHPARLELHLLLTVPSASSPIRPRRQARHCWIQTECKQSPVRFVLRNPQEPSVPSKRTSRPWSLAPDVVVIIMDRLI